MLRCQLMNDNSAANKIVLVIRKNVYDFQFASDYNLQIHTNILS